MNITLLEKELRRDEGVRRNPYKDTEGYLTVGIGYNLDARPLPEGVTLPLSDKEISLLFNINIVDVVKGLDMHIPWWSRLDEVRQRVMANMAFNLGIYGLLGFRNTLAFIEKGDYKAASAGMRKSKWYKQVGRRAERLAIAMETGVMPSV
jgi:lysozyme